MDLTSGPIGLPIGSVCGCPTSCGASCGVSCCCGRGCGSSTTWGSPLLTAIFSLVSVTSISISICSTLRCVCVYVCVCMCVCVLVCMCVYVCVCVCVCMYVYIVSEPSIKWYSLLVRHVSEVSSIAGQDPIGQAQLAGAGCHAPCLQAPHKYSKVPVNT